MAYPNQSNLLVNHAHRTLHEMIAKGIIEQHTQIHLSSTSAAIVALETPVIPEFHLCCEWSEGSVCYFLG